MPKQAVEVAVESLARRHGIGGSAFTFGVGVRVVGIPMIRVTNGRKAVAFVEPACVGAESDGVQAQSRGPQCFFGKGSRPVEQHFPHAFSRVIRMAADPFDKDVDHPVRTALTKLQLTGRNDGAVAEAKAEVDRVDKFSFFGKLSTD